MREAHDGGRALADDDLVAHAVLFAQARVALTPAALRLGPSVLTPALIPAAAVITLAVVTLATRDARLALHFDPHEIHRAAQRTTAPTLLVVVAVGTAARSTVLTRRATSTVTPFAFSLFLLVVLLTLLALLELFLLALLALLALLLFALLQLFVPLLAFLVLTTLAPHQRSAFESAAAVVVVTSRR